MSSSLTTEVGPAHFYTRKKKKTTLQLPYLGNFLDFLSVVSAFLWFLWNYNFNLVFNKLKVYNFNFWLSILSQGLYLRHTLIAFPTLCYAEQEAWSYQSLTTNLRTILNTQLVVSWLELFRQLLKWAVIPANSFHEGEGEDRCLYIFSHRTQ